MTADMDAAQRGASSAMRVAVIEDDEPTRSFLAATVRSEGYACLEADDGLSGLNLIRDESPDLVLLDILMPNMTGLDVLRRVRSEHLDPIVVVNTAYGSEEHAIEALRLRANDYLKKPIRHAELVALLRKYEPVVAARKAPSLLPEFVESRRCVSVIENDLRIVPAVAEYMTNEGEMGRNRDVGLRCTLGLVELITNAIEHGNLGVSGAEKLRCLAGSGDAFGEILRQRASEPSRAQTRVRIELVSTREVAEWTVLDQGEGFDWKAIMDSLESFDALSPHGRGIFLACASFDEVEYNGRGNEVRARKLKRPAP